ncbi:endonuclease III [bacterium]|nr:endonuclease III [bacterium]
MHADSPLWEQVDERAREEVAKRKPKPADIERAARLYERLAEEFPDVHCALHFTNAFELLCATILSAQCTDERVNMVTPELFRRYPTPARMMAVADGELEEVIRTTGFFNSKAKALRETSRTLVEEFGGEVPMSIPELMKLRGTARKTANVVRMHAFGLPGISVDTHYGRITQRLGLTTAKDPEKIEFDTAALLPPERWTHFADAVILHGRKTCQARAPKCESCRLAELCPSAGKVDRAKELEAKSLRKASAKKK